jgi:hypothetical protein
MMQVAADVLFYRLLMKCATRTDMLHALAKCTSFACLQRGNTVQHVLKGWILPLSYDCKYF